MLNPKVFEAWYTLMAEAMRGTAEAQDAFQKLSDMSSNPQDFNRWMAQFMPGAASSFNFRPENFEDQLEAWWRMMGVVPRNRYLELLEKCDALERKLAKAEETITSLRQRLGSQGQQEDDAKKVLDMWGTVMEETLKTQTEWMKTWTAMQPPASAKTEETTQSSSVNADAGTNE